MTSRERVYRTLEFRNPDRAPCDLWALAGVTMLRRPEFDELLLKYPSDFAGPNGRYGKSSVSRGTPAEVGEYIDEWGCVWNVAEVGVCGEVKRPPLADWSALATWSPPWEVLENADLSGVNAWCAETDLFVKTGTQVRPFERLQFLRGSENLYLDLAWQPAEFCKLCEMVHEFFLADFEMWLKTDIDGIGFMDDWGAQKSLLISPELWRSIFKPMYKDYCDMAKAAGKKIFFHSDGYIMDIYPDLIELGVDAVNSQLFCMDIEEIARLHKGKITFWGEISRQDILPFGTVEDVRAAVWRVRRALDDGRGGLIAQCEWGVRDPKENIEAVYDTWLQPMPVNAQ
jgi:hypothetical protein